MPVPGPVPVPERKVKVAAVQFFSYMGNVEENRKRLLELAGQAADEGAKIVVFPETALQGYMDPDGYGTWRSPGFKGDARELTLGGVAETVPGPSTALFAEFSKKRGIYVLLTLVEVDEQTGLYYNSAVLLGPEGRMLVHYRKAEPWTVAEYGWASKGDGKALVVDTPLGRLGVMICYDVHTMLPKLEKARADIVLWPVWWVDHDPALWFDERLPDLCRRHGMAIVAANRAETQNPNEEPGAGYSRVVSSKGEVVAKASDGLTDYVVGTVSVAEKRK
jgi:predicted amidohydrolase